MKIQESSVLEKLSETIYRFRYMNDPSRNYVVEVELGMCSCPVGVSGALRKHQVFAVQELGLPSVNFVPQYSVEGRRLFAIIALRLGEKQVLNALFFAGIHEKKQSAKVEHSEMITATHCE